MSGKHLIVKGVPEGARRAARAAWSPRECSLPFATRRSYSERFSWGPSFRVEGKRCHAEKRSHMFGWAITFLIIALIAAVLGFGGIAGTAIEIAKIIFFVALILFAISAVVGLVRGRSAPVP